MLHTLLCYLCLYRDNEQHTYKNLLPGSEHVVSWPVHEEVTMELVIARSWGCIGDTEAEVTVYFRGVVPVPASLSITGGQRVSELIRVFAPLSATEISPAGKLEKWVTAVKPTSNKILPLGERDRLPGDDKPIYQSVFEYDIELTEAADVICRWPGLQRSLYESQFVGQFFMIYNHKKSLVGVGDAWPKSTKLGKGKHTVRLQVRHTSTSTLEGFADMPLLLERTLKNHITLTFYPSQTEALAGGEKLSNRTIPIGSSTSFYLREPSYDNLPKTASAGDSFTGSISYIKKNAYAIGNSQDKYPVKYVVADTKPKAASTTSSPTPTPTTDTTTGAAAKTEVSPTDAAVSEYDKTIKDAKIKHLKSCIGNKKTFDPVYTLVSTDYPTEVTVQSCKPAHLEKLLQTEYTTANKLKTQNATSNNSIISTEIDTLKHCITLCEEIKLSTNSVITSIEQDAIALEYGRNLDKEDPTAGARRKEIDIQKSALIEALFILSKSYLIWIASVERVEVLSKLTPPVTVEPTGPSADTTTTPPHPTAESTGTTQSIPREAVAVEKTNTPTLIAEYQATLKELGKWVDLADEKYAPLQVGRNRLLGRHGLALKKVYELIASSEYKHTAETKEHYYQVSLHYTLLHLSL